MEAQESYTKFLSSIEEIDGAEGKLRACLDFMKITMNKEKTPAFRAFWQAKHLCLDLFKNQMTQRVRSGLWTEYLNLHEEMKQVKKVLDEQSSFTEEQIQLALDALKNDLENFDSSLDHTKKIDFPKGSKTLSGKDEFYVSRQQSLDLLNNFAQRIQSLRKELVSTQMRVSRKNQLFQLLSKLGDQIFPKRKELIKVISKAFQEDVEAFVSQQTSSDNRSLFPLKEEIKTLQSFAKSITLGSSAFKQTREKLSSVWNEIKKKESESRSAFAEKKEAFKQNFEAVVSKIEEISTDMNEKEIDTRIQEIQEEMKKLELGRDEVKELKKRLSELKKPFEEKRAALRQAAKEKEQKTCDEQKQFFQKLEAEIENLGEATLEALVEKYETLLKEGMRFSFEGQEQFLIDLRFGLIKDQIEEKKWKKLLEQESEDKITRLYDFLEERQAEKRKIKHALEEQRKALGASNLSFEQSLNYQELMDEGKTRLESLEILIEEIEDKLFELER